MSAGQLLLSLLMAALKAGVLLALAAVISLALRRAPARARQSVWAGALVGALLVPLLSPWVPEWTIALPLPVLSAAPSGAMAVPERPDRFSPAFAANEPANGPRTGVRAADTDLAGRASLATEAAGLWARVAGVPPASWLLGVWLLGCLASFGWFLRGLRNARRLERGATGADARWRERLEEARRLVGIRRGVRLLHSPETPTPMTWGWLRPVVLMPSRSLSWSRERSRIVLLHELVHVRRGDWLVRALGRLVCSIYWLNPLAWLAARRLVVEQEIACDEEVVALGTRPSSYARHLLAIARSAGPAAAIPAHALDMARRSQMEGRLMSILDGSRRLRGGRKLAILALLLIAGLVPALAAIEPWVGDPEPPAPFQGEEATGSISSADTEGLARVLGELEAIEVELEPFEEGLDAIAVEMEPLEQELERLSAQMEPLARNGRQDSEDLERLTEQMQEVHERMAPLHERMDVIHEEMEPIFERLSEAQRKMEPLHERMGTIHEEMAPVFERMAAVHQEMEPLHERMAGVHEQMAPVFERMGAAHERLSPFHERMGEQHERLEPYYQQMGEIHERMQPLHEQMGQRHLELEGELQAVVERMLVKEFSGVTAAGTDHAVAAARIVDAVSLRVEDGRLRIMSSASQLRAILGETLGPLSAASDAEFARAVERFVRAIGDLEVAAA